MAWQTPKTDWAAADAVRDTDFNRIESNILELYQTNYLRSERTLYVATTGNDTTGTGTSSAPFATITKALSILPKNLNGFNAVISVAAGNYSGNVTLSGFSGGTIRVYSGGTINIVGNLTISNCSYVWFNPSALTVSGAIEANGASIVKFQCTVSSSNASSYGVLALNGAKVIFDLPYTKHNSSSYAAYATSAEINFTSVSGNGNANGMFASMGGVITYSDLFMTVTGSLTITASGGRIYSSVQTGLPGLPDI